MANRLKSNCLTSVFHEDQSGFLKGRNIANNVRLLADIIDYTEIDIFLEPCYFWPLKRHLIAKGMNSCVRSYAALTLVMISFLG